MMELRIAARNGPFFVHFTHCLQGSGAPSPPPAPARLVVLVPAPVQPTSEHVQQFDFGSLGIDA
ncbi:MAG TPA: hypothetical protein VHM70_25030, partial [Polyangiaceae bacterium]|nr:hypothetical protein [Polyangiaceae bacterium]